MFGTYKLTISYIHILLTRFQIFGENGEVKILTYTEGGIKIL
jgi:hypothetical protein